MANFDYDLFVIGGGSGGVRAARIAAGYGAKVAVAEEFRLGGTCVIRGCVPKKLLVYASRFADEFADARGFGWSVPPATFDWSALIASKDREIARLEQIYRTNLGKAGVEIIDTRAVLDGPGRVRLLASGKVASARTILIATGGWPVGEPGIEGADLAISSNEAFNLTALPRHIVIAGGGYIAVEFAGIFHGLGAEVTLIYRGEQILRGFDQDMRDGLVQAMTERGIRICNKTTIRSIARSDDRLAVALSSGETLAADQVMLAIGRQPNTRGLGLETVGVATGPNGAVVVDAQSATNVPGIYAVGDVTDRVNLTPVAIREGHAFADTVFGGKPATVGYDMIPTAVFATPEIGTVGMPEDVARGIFSAVDIYKTRFRPMRHVMAGREERTIMKLIVDAGTDRVVGCHVLGPDAGEIVQMAAIAMRMGATKADFDQTMALHPSAAEEMVTLRTKWQPSA